MDKNIRIGIVKHINGGVYEKLIITFAGIVWEYDLLKIFCRHNIFGSCEKGLKEGLLWTKKLK